MLIIEYSISVVSAVATTAETKTVLALMKRLSISAEDAERAAAVAEVVALVKEGGVSALKVRCTSHFCDSSSQFFHSTLTVFVR